MDALQCRVRMGRRQGCVCILLPSVARYVENTSDRDRDRDGERDILLHLLLLPALLPLHPEAAVRSLL